MTEQESQTAGPSGVNGVGPTTAPPAPSTPPQASPPPRPHSQGETPTPPRGQPVLPPPAPARGADEALPPNLSAPQGQSALSPQDPGGGARHAQPVEDRGSDQLLGTPRRNQVFGTQAPSGAALGPTTPPPQNSPPPSQGWGHDQGSAGPPHEAPQRLPAPQPQPTRPPLPAPQPPRPPQPAQPPWQPDRGAAPAAQRDSASTTGPFPPPPPGWPAQSGPAGAEQPGQPRQGWAGHPAAAASPGQWSYVDSLRQGELVPTRKIPPTRGWRRAVHVMTFKFINLGRSADERRQHELEAKVRSLLRGHYKIGILGKGGVGKTTVAAAVGSQMALLRQDDRVVAIDADTAFGKLGSRIDPGAHGSYWELAADLHLHSFTDVRSRVGSNPAGLFVLPGEPSARRRRVLDPSIYRQATAQLDRHFTISIVDCGSTMDAAVTAEVLQDLDALIVVTTPWFDAASAAGQTLEWLADKGSTALLYRTVVVVNDNDGRGEKKTRATLVEQFSRRGQTVIEMPYDQHLRPGGVVDIVNELNPDTRRRVLEIAASIAEHFAATTDGPRERR